MTDPFALRSGCRDSQGPRRGIQGTLWRALHEIRKRRYQCHRGPFQSLNKSSPSSLFLTAQSLQHHSPVSRRGIASWQLFWWEHHTGKKNNGGPLHVFLQSLILLPGNISSPCIARCCYCHNSYGAEGVSLHVDVRGEAQSLAVVWELMGKVGNISCSPGMKSYFVLHRFKLGSTSLNQK